MRFFILLFGLFLTGNIQAQSTKNISILGISTVEFEALSDEDKKTISDGLLEWKKAKSDTLKIRILQSIGKELPDNSSLKIDLYSTIIKHLEKSTLDGLKPKTWFDNELASAYGEKGRLLYYKGKTEEAEKFYFKAINLSRKNKNEKSLATQLNNLGSLYSQAGKVNEAIAALEESSLIRFRLKDEEGLATIYNNLASVYYRQDLFDEALGYYRKAYEIDKRLNDSISMSISLVNISVVYDKIGKDQKSYETMYESYKICRTLDFKPGIAMALNNLGAHEYRKMNDSLSVNYYSEALQISEELDYSDWISQALTGLSKTHLRQSKLDLAYTEAKRALALSEKTNYLVNIRDVSLVLYEIEQVRGNYKQALGHFRLHNEMKDSITNESYIKSAIQNTFKQEYTMKAVEDSVKQVEAFKIKNLQLSKSRQQRNYLFLGLALITAFALIIFNRFRVISKQKKIISIEQKKSDDLLLNILPAQVAQELKDKGSTTPRLYEKCTIIFTDFSGFTQISEKLTPSELVLILDKIFLEFDTIIEKYGISRIKTIGDAYMCAAGLPEYFEAHAESSIKAALEMRDYINLFNSNLNENDPKWNIRIGIHSGSVVAGVVGIKKFAFDIWGDTVNIAARMESSGEIGKVNISEQTENLVRGKFNSLHRGKIKAKNKGEIDMYFVENN